jgi:hypothetical protein
VNRTGGSGPKTVCSNVTATSCNDDGVTYDGTTYQYAVTATNATGGAAHTTAGSVASFKAIGTPLSITTLSAPEPGSINSITVNYTTVAARGASSTVKIYEGGTLRSSKTESPNGGQSSSQTFAVSYDGNSHGFTAVVCNETACGTNSNSASQKPYTNPSVSAFDAYTSGNTVFVNVSANGGGRPVHLSLTNDRGWSHGADFTDNYSTTLNLGDVGWSYSSDFYLALTDSSGRGRPTVNRGPDHVTTPPPPPPPSVTLTRDTNCTYFTGCRIVSIELKNWPPNSSVFCKELGVNMKNWVSTVTVDGNGYHSPFTWGYVEGTNIASRLYDSASAPTSPDGLCVQQ